MKRASRSIFGNRKPKTNGWISWKCSKTGGTMQDMNSLTHSVWVCKYHMVWIPKYRKKKLYGDIAKYLGETFHELARQRESRIVEGHICQDHIHMLIEIPPKYAVAQVIVPKFSNSIQKWQDIGQRIPSRGTIQVRETEPVNSFV
jgi:hypothetical protein